MCTLPLSIEPLLSIYLCIYIHPCFIYWPSKAFLLWTLYSPPPRDRCAPSAAAETPPPPPGTGGATHLDGVVVQRGLLGARQAPRAGRQLLGQVLGRRLARVRRRRLARGLLDRSSRRLRETGRSELLPQPPGATVDGPMCT